MSIQNILLLFGGIGLLLYGMKIMGEGLELAAGSKLQHLLEVLTNNRFLGVFVGFLITAVIQSSSATTVMIVGFVNAGLMNLAQAVGVIMGANIGTTVTSVLVAINLTEIAPMVIFIGVAIIMFAKKSQHKLIGQIITGFGILFLGMSTMSNAMEPLRTYEPFKVFISSISNPFLGVLIGIFMTCVLQSSSASVAILQALAMQGLIPLKVAVFILYGQNIGTCITALLSSIGTSKNSRRAAIIHLLFNCIGAGLFIGISLIPGYIPWINNLEINMQGKISVAHIIFNIVTTVLIFPFANVLVSLSKKIIPGEDQEKATLSLEFLDPRILNTPPFAVAQVGKEVERMANLALENLTDSTKALITGDLKNLDPIQDKENLINYLNHQITDYLVKINALDIQDNDAEFIGSLFHVINDIERIGDHAMNVSETAQKVSSNKSDFSEQAAHELQHIVDATIELVNRSIDVFRTHELSDNYGEDLYTLEESIDNMTERYSTRHIERLRRGDCTPESGIQFNNALTDLERVADHAINIAFSVHDSVKK